MHIKSIKTETINNVDFMNTLKYSHYNIILHKKSSKKSQKNIVKIQMFIPLESLKTIN